MRYFLILILTFLINGFPHVSFAECKDHVELYSAEYLVKEYGKSAMWVLTNAKINLWEKETPNGKGRKVGQMLPGSHALILAVGSEDYRVKSPLDKSIDWVNKIQVKQVIKQDTETKKPCK